ncbi:MAG: 2-phosphosulfolactate phosphatase [Candidatus Asgardarchaeia archaeon]
MEIRIVPSYDERIESLSRGSISIAIDVLRATSSIVTAIYKGASIVIPVSSVEEAFSMKEKMGDVILAGEVDCFRIEGFDKGNSPLEFLRDDVMGKKIILKTTNGTPLVRKLRHSRKIFACSLLNLSATVNAVRDALEEFGDIRVLIAEAGTKGLFTEEDHLCATLLSQKIMGIRLDLSDVTDYILSTPNGKKLIKKGFYEDVKFCSKIDRFNVVVEHDGVGFVSGSRCVKI